MTDLADREAPQQSLEEFLARAEAWLDQHAPPRTEVAAADPAWGSGSDSVAIFPDVSAEEERTLLDAVREWHRQKFDAGYAAMTWSPDHGGQGLPRNFEMGFYRLEGRYQTPAGRELLAVTQDLIAPTIRAHGTDRQRDRFLSPMLRSDEMWCQLFSEPGAGSDLANLSTRAERDGDVWRITGQKVWTSGAHMADWGYAICRTDAAAPKHKGLTAFLIPMMAPGVTVRPLRQMSGGASFNEVFFDDVEVGDELRLGAVGDGWRVALTTLGFERSSSNGAEGGGQLGGTWGRLLALARHFEVTDDPVMRQSLAEVYIHNRLLRMNRQRVVDQLRSGQTPGPEGSLGKLLWTQNMRRIGEVAAAILGPRITADNGEWGTYAWVEHLMGAPGYRIAGGSDEVQRNIIGERVLGLPGEPRVDRDRPWNEVPR